MSKTQPSPQDTSRRSRALLLATLVILNTAAWIYALKFAKPAAYWATDVGLCTVGASTLIAYYLGYAPMLVIAGVLADRFRPRILLLVSAIAATAVAILAIFLHDGGVLYARNIAFGMFFGMVLAPGLTLISKTYPAAERVRASTIFLSASSLASVGAIFLALPPIPGHLSWAHAFILVAVLLVAGLAGLLFIRDTPPQHAETDSEPHRLIHDTATIFRTRSFWLLLIGAIASGVCYPALGWSTYGALSLDGANALLTAFFVSFAAIIICTFAVFSGWILDRLFRGNSLRFMATGLTVAAAGSLFSAIVPMPWYLWFLCTTIPSGLGLLAFLGTLTTVAAPLVGPRRVGTVMGVLLVAQLGGALALAGIGNSWILTSATGHAMLAPISAASGIILILGAIAVSRARAERTDGKP